MQDNEQDKKLNSSGYVPEEDDKGIRKTFTTPEFVEAKDNTRNAKYPWATIGVGESFPILHNEMKRSSVDPFVSRMSKKHNKRFQVTDCPDYGCYLISCIEAIQTSSNVVEALHKLPPQNIIEALKQEKDKGE